MSPERRKSRSADPSFALQCCLASLAGKSRAAAIVVTRLRHANAGAPDREGGTEGEVIGSFNRTTSSTEALLVDPGPWSRATDSREGLCISIYRAARDGGAHAEAWDEPALAAVFEAARAAALRICVARATHERAA